MIFPLILIKGLLLITKLGAAGAIGEGVSKETLEKTKQFKEMRENVKNFLMLFIWTCFWLVLS